MSDEKEDKTEEPTEKKIRDSIEKGQTPYSREVSLFMSLGAMLIIISLMMKENARPLLSALVQVFAGADRYPLNNAADIISLLSLVGGAAAIFLVPIFVLMIVSTVVAAFTQGIPRMSGSRIAPKFSKISPVAGLKRILSKNGVIEFLKSLGKLAVVSIVTYMVLKGDFEALVQAIFVDPTKIGSMMLDMLVRLLSGCCVAYALITGADLVWSKFKWRGELRMTKQEIKDELKSSEGDPIYKAKRRSIALDRHRRRMMANVPKATMVIANPTHYAIAIRYVREEGGAPMVLAKGQDLIALKIRAIAEAAGIPVIEDKALARSMYDHVEVSKMIPAEFFKAIAELIHFLQARAPRSSRSFQR